MECAGASGAGPRHPRASRTTLSGGLTRHWCTGYRCGRGSKRLLAATRRALGVKRCRMPSGVVRHRVCGNVRMYFVRSFRAPKRGRHSRQRARGTGGAGRWYLQMERRLYSSGGHPRSPSTPRGFGRWERQPLIPVGCVPAQVAGDSVRQRLVAELGVIVRGPRRRKGRRRLTDLHGSRRDRDRSKWRPARSATQSVRCRRAGDPAPTTSRVRGGGTHGPGEGGEWTGGVGWRGARASGRSA